METMHSLWLGPIKPDRAEKLASPGVVEAALCSGSPIQRWFQIFSIDPDEIEYFTLKASSVVRSCVVAAFLNLVFV